MWYPIVSWGAHWYESNNQWEVILEDVEDIEFHIESLVQGNVRTEKISLGKFPETCGIFNAASDRNIISG